MRSVFGQRRVTHRGFHQNGVQGFRSGWAFGWPRVGDEPDPDARAGLSAARSAVRTDSEFRRPSQNSIQPTPIQCARETRKEYVDDRSLTINGIENKRIRQRTLHRNQVPELIGLSSGFVAVDCKWSRVSFPANSVRRSYIRVALERGESPWLLIL
jgi:hypothetical protein